MPCRKTTSQDPAEASQMETAVSNLFGIQHRREWPQQINYALRSNKLTMPQSDCQGAPRSLAPALEGDPSKPPTRRVLWPCSCQPWPLSSVIWTCSALCYLQTCPLQSPESGKDTGGGGGRGSECWLYWQERQGRGVPHGHCQPLQNHFNRQSLSPGRPAYPKSQARGENWASQLENSAPTARPLTWRLICFTVWPFLHNLARLSYKMVKGFAKIHITLTYTHFCHRAMWNLSEYFYLQIECTVLQ